MNDTAEKRLQQEVNQSLGAHCGQAGENLRWLLERMHGYFAITMQDEPEAVCALALRLQSLEREQRLMLTDRENRLVIARLNRPGSVYDTLRPLRERDISYAQFSQSYGPIPGLDEELELQRFDFERRPHREVMEAGESVCRPPSAGTSPPPSRPTTPASTASGSTISCGCCG